MRQLSRLFLLILTPALAGSVFAQVGSETSGYRHLQNGDEYSLSIEDLLLRGEQAFTATWTIEEGAGRPLTSGTGGGLADPSSPLVFPRNFNRISAMDSNGCSGCHNAPFAGGGGDFVTGVFVAGQRFDSVTFNHSDPVELRGAVNEDGEFVTLPDVANYRATIGMFGAGYIEMLARQMTADLQAIRDGLPVGGAALLESKGVSFGVLQRTGVTSYDVSAVEGLPESSLAGSTPSLIIQPFHQSGSVVSLRQFTNNAFNHHHGMQSEERFGSTDIDGDGVTRELTRADITAATIWQASLQAPGRVVPKDPVIEQAIVDGEELFDEIGCTGCHVQALPLDDKGWIYTEPNPYNPAGNLQTGEAPRLSVDLSSSHLPGYRLKPVKGVVMVRAFTDLKLHDITSGPGDPNEEAININVPNSNPAFLDGNRRFLTKKLWGAANERPYFHHGKYTTLREATLGHAGEALQSRQDFEALPSGDQDKIIEFLKSLQVLPENIMCETVDEDGNPRPNWTKHN